MNTLAVLSGSWPAKLTVPHTPTNPLGQLVGASAGSSPWLQARIAATALATGARVIIAAFIRPEELPRRLHERLRDALSAALDAATPPGNLRDLATQMREAVVEAKVSVQETRAAVTRAEGELVVERQRLADAERRGRLAAEIQDQETVAVAGRF